MSNHERNYRSLLLGKCQKLGSEIQTDVAIESHKVRAPEGEQDRKQQQWIADKLSQCLSLFNQEA